MPFVGSQITQFLTDDFTKALKDYLKTLELDPKHSFAYCNIGCIKHSSNEISTAINYYTKAIQLNSTIADFFYRRGLAYYDIGAYKNALDDYNKILELEPDNEEVRDCINKCLQELNEQ